VASRLASDPFPHQFEFSNSFMTVAFLATDPQHALILILMIPNHGSRVRGFFDGEVTGFHSSMPRSSDNSTSWSGSHFILPRLGLNLVRRGQSQNTLFVLLSLMPDSPSQHLDCFQHRSPRPDAREPHHPLVHRLAHSSHFTNPRKGFSLFFALDLTAILLNSWVLSTPD
jgi:hypothetical protein